VSIIVLVFLWLILLEALIYLPIKVSFSFRSTTQTLPLSMFISTGLLDELEQLLKGVAMMKELTLRTRDYLVSFGECMSTRIFAAYLNKLGKKARQVSQMLCFYTHILLLSVYYFSCRKVVFFGVPRSFSTSNT